MVKHNHLVQVWKLDGPVKSLRHLVGEGTYCASSISMCCHSLPKFFLVSPNGFVEIGLFGTVNFFFPIGFLASSRNFVISIRCCYRLCFNSLKGIKI